MFLLILVQIYKKNRGKPHVERNIYKEKTYIIRWRLIFGMKKEDFLPVNATLFYRKVTELSHVVQERAEGQKLQKQHALKGQKLLAQGIALGIMAGNKAPCKGKSLINCLGVLKLLPLQGDKLAPVITQGDALG